MPEPSQAEHDRIIGEIIAAAGAGDLAPIIAHLHPYLHWTSANGRTTRGRSQVMDLLSASLVDPPDRVEWRDGQVYRWWASAR